MPDYWVNPLDSSKLIFDETFISKAYYVQRVSPKVPQPVIWGTLTNCTERYQLKTEGGVGPGPEIPES